MVTLLALTVLVITALDVLGALGTLVVFIVGVFGMYVLARGSLNKARIEGLQGDNNDLRQRDHDREIAITELKAADVLKQQKIDALQHDNERLEEMVLQRANVAELIVLNRALIDGVTELTKTMTGHAKEAREHWGRMEAQYLKENPE